MGDDAWIERWRDEVRADVSRLLENFESHFGYPPGEYRVDGPAAAAELTDTWPAELVAFHRVVAVVDLPDVGNGYCIYRPSPPGTDRGDPCRLSDGRAIVVFGSDGGGAMFALTASSDAPVLRLADGALIGDTYDADRAVEIAANLRVFLTSVRHELAEYTGS